MDSCRIKKLPCLAGCRETQNWVLDKTNWSRGRSLRWHRAEAIKDRVVEVILFKFWFSFTTFRMMFVLVALPESYLWSPVSQRKRMLPWTSAEEGDPCSLQSLFSLPPQKILIFFFFKKWRGSFPPAYDVIAYWWKESSAAIVAKKCDQALWGALWRIPPAIRQTQTMVREAELRALSWSGHRGGHSFETLQGYKKWHSVVWTVPLDEWSPSWSGPR